jgi:D-tagatose-1,6-bisphosphate aldolase subunit GatZ/KbaZ
MNPLKELLLNRHESNIKGVYSACTANATVLKACLVKAKATDTPIVIEATANQVDQYGGYTGMKPIDFKNMVKDLCIEVGYDFNRVILGGDHLGPLTFVGYDEAKAMEEAKELVKQYVLAGFTKIHIDTSMKISSDDQHVMLPTQVIAQRASVLMEVANQAFKELKKKDPQAVAPCFIVGSEVPIPGGEQEEVDTLEVTKVKDFQNQVAIFKDTLPASSWEDVVAIVVQPGVEFGDNQVFYYDSAKAQDLVAAKAAYPNLVFEGHSTDYQTKEHLKQMVDDDIAILKVGPALTFGYRQALFALAQIESDMMLEDASNLKEVLETVMLEDPKYWQKYYSGDKRQQKLKRAFSYSDRIRYYLPYPEVDAAIKKLHHNIDNNEIIMPVIYQWLPKQYERIVNNQLELTFEALVMDVIGDFVDDYLYATIR